ncbi:hypothetical protein PspLS_07452 [Pyricularia sp. CBS 133598]|nr:hypothetical protein PspLS_07452 [Pyricularia sp. CBS 133598]
MARSGNARPSICRCISHYPTKTPSQLMSCVLGWGIMSERAAFFISSPLGSTVSTTLTVSALAFCILSI